MADERSYEIVLFGATGFTGALVAEYLAEHAPVRTRWALAGRSVARLQAVRQRLARLNSTCAELPLLVADVDDATAIRELAASTRVVISTVGPYMTYGEPLVAACAAMGTDYVDLAAEPEFVDRMWLRYHHQAQATGARLVHTCGFDSIPYDLGALFTVGQLPADVRITLTGYVRAGGTFSGGTFHSAVNAMGRLRQARRVGRERRAADGSVTHLRTDAPCGGRRVHGVAGRPHHEPLAGGWVVPAPTIDPQQVLRSARALERYGPDFSYAHYMVTGTLVATGALIGAVATVVALSQLGPTRDVLLKVRSPGQGPSAEQRARSFFRVRMVADTSATRLITEVSGGDPGYGETAKMVSEAALCLAHDELPERSGQLTPAVAMGERLIDRLVRAGIQFRVLE